MYLNTVSWYLLQHCWQWQS